MAMAHSPPVYIVSKGRADSRLTSKALEKMGVQYRIVVEEQEHEQYAAVIDPSKVLILDPAYQREYNACCDIAEGESKGSGPARNFVWDHAEDTGAAWHWIMDDNIRGFHRLNKNKINMVFERSILTAMEDFSSRYVNVAMAGPKYSMFAKSKHKLPPFVLNTRLFSCNLIRNDVPFRWRGRYNEDTDLSLRMLKAGWCTIQFNAFLQNKTSTLKMRGGNTDEIYRDGTYKKSKMIVDLHPDVARLAWRFGRCHHHVDYRPFKKNKLRRRDDADVPQGVNNYGMVLKHI